MAAGERYVILAEFLPYDPVSSSAVTVRACSVDDARVTSLNGVAWWPAISGAPRRTLDLFDGEFGGKISAGIGDIEIALAAFPNAARYAWGERPVKLWRGVPGATWGSFTLIFEGLTRPPRASNGRMRIGLRVDDRWLDKPLLSTYAGTGNAEGPADLKGQPKPLALGAPQFVEGVIINRALNIVQIHGYGAINGVPTALSRLSRYSAAAGNDASYAALASATIAPGAWRTCLAEGLVRFGAPPGGVASFLMQGDSGSALGWVRTPGQVIRRIALIAGATAGQIDSTSLAALDTACPYNISLYLRDQTSARDVIQSIAASCNAAAGVSWLGKLFVTRATIGSPAITLAANGTALPPVANVEMLESSAPFWRTALEGERTYRVHSAGEFESLDYAELTGAPASLADINATEGTKLGGVADNATRNVFRGIYNSGTAYVIGDEVSNGANDRLYFAVANSTGAALTNTAFWSLKLVTGGGAAGDNAVNVRLSNPLIMVATAPDGSGGSYSGLTCQIEVYDGVVRKDTLGVCTFAVVGAPGYASVGATSGLITITDWGTTSASPQFDATYAGVTYRVTLQLLRSLQGAAGPALTMAGGGAITYVDGVLNPGGQSRTLTITRQGIVGTAVWTTVPGGVTLTGTGDSRTLSAADMGSNKQVTIRATVGSVFDEDIVIRIDASTAEAGATAGDNLIANAGLANDSAPWILQPGWTRGSAGSPAPAPFALFIGTTSAAAIANGGVYQPLTARQLYVSAQVYRNTAAAGLLQGVIYWRDAAGGAISSSALGFAGTTIDTWQLVAGTLIAPANAASWLFQIEANQTAGAAIIAAPRVSTTQLGADVTAAQPIVSLLSAATGRALAGFASSDGTPFARIVEIGEARDGNVIVFSTTYSVAPQLVFFYGGAAAAAGNNVSIRFEALTGSGFTFRAKSQSVSVGSTITDGSASSGGGGEPTLIINRTDSGAPFDGRFVFSTSVTVGEVAPGEPGRIRVGLFVKQSSAWVQVGSISAGADGTYTEAVSPGAVDFGAGAEFGVTALSATGTGTALDSFNSVVYTLGTVTETSLTPAGASPIRWEARL